jgi:hypothetical protein
VIYCLEISIISQCNITLASSKNTDKIWLEHVSMTKTHFLRSLKSRLNEDASIFSTTVRQLTEKRRFFICLSILGSSFANALFLRLVAHLRVCVYMIALLCMFVCLDVHICLGVCVCVCVCVCVLINSFIQHQSENNKFDLLTLTSIS